MYKVLSIFAIIFLLQTAIGNSEEASYSELLGTLCATVKHVIDGLTDSKDQKNLTLQDDYDKICISEEKMQSNDDPNSSNAVSQKVPENCYDHLQGVLRNIREHLKRTDQETFGKYCAAYSLNLELCDYPKNFKEDLQNYYKNTCDTEKIKKWLALKPKHPNPESDASALRAASAHITVVATLASLFRFAYYLG